CVYPGGWAWRGLGGRAANLRLMLLAVVWIHGGVRLDWFHDGPGGQAGLPETVLIIFYRLNLLLGVFNLLPVPPLDGSTGIMLFMGEGTARSYLDWLRASPYRLVGLLVAFYGFRYLYGPLWNFVPPLLLFGPFSPVGFGN